MSTQTTNLNLIKPGDNDALDIADINDNTDTLDAAVGAVDVSTDGSLQEQINDLGESVNQRLTAKVKNVSGTTTVNGSLYLELDVANAFVIAIKSDSNRCIPFITSSGAYWALVVDVTGSSITAKPSIAQTATVYYLEW